MAPGPGVQERARARRLEAAAAGGRASSGYARDRHRAHRVRPGRDGALPPRARHRPHRRARHGAAPRGARAAPARASTAAETRAWCAARGPRRWSRDPSNADPAYARARVRGGLLPRPGRGPPRRRGARGRRSRTLLRDEAELLAPLVEAAWARVARRPRASTRRPLRAEPRAMRRLLVRRLIAEAGLRWRRPGRRAGRARARPLLDGGGGGACRAAGGGWSAGGRSRSGLRPPRRPRPPSRRPWRCPARRRSASGACARRRRGRPRRRPRRGRGAPGGPLAVVRSPRPGDRLALPRRRPRRRGTPAGGRRGARARCAPWCRWSPRPSGSSGWPATGPPPTSWCATGPAPWSWSCSAGMSERHGRRGPDLGGGPAGADRRDRRARLRGLRRPRPARDRRPEGRDLLHLRPRPAPRRPLRARLHGRLLLRLVDPLVRGRADPEGPRHPDRRAATCCSWRTSIDSGPDALVPA